MKLSFDASKGEIDWVASYPTPHEFVRAFWVDLTIGDFEELCDWALRDAEAYDYLFSWACAQKDLEPEIKADLFDILVRKKPRKGKERTAFRDNRMRLLSNMLVAHYGLNQRQTAELLASLIKSIDVKRIMNILSQK
jgi:hypothetical protein